MRFVSAASTAGHTAEALDAVVAEIRQGLGGAVPDLVLVFATPHHGLEAEGIGHRLRAAFPGATLVGCSGAYVLGEGQEIEGGPGLTVLAGVLPGVVCTPVRWGPGLTGPGTPPDPRALALAMDVPPREVVSLLLFTDPHTVQVPNLLPVVDALMPHAVVLGGIASGGRNQGEHLLWCDTEVFHDGAVAVALSGDVAVHPLVAPGARGVGDTWRVSEVAGPLVLALDGDSALDVLEAAVEAMSTEDRALFRRGPLVGVARDPGAETDFVVRHLAGVDPRRKGFVIGHELAEGDVLQLHVRDAAASAEDVHARARAHAAIHGPPAGALLCACLGRGRGLYGRSGVDSEALRAHLGATLPIAGFFGHGEIGPVAGETSVHGYTAVAALFHPVTWN